MDVFFSFPQGQCHEIADKYIEFEPIVIAIDLVLLSRPTYRHVLYNTEFKVMREFMAIFHSYFIIFEKSLGLFYFQIHWKLALILCLVDAYISWSNKTHVLASEFNHEHFTREKMFYFCFALAVAGKYSID